MIFNLDEKKEASLSQITSNIELVLEDEGPTSLTLILPPYEDILEMQNFNDRHFSLKQFVENKRLKDKDVFLNAYNRLEKKYSRFEKAPTYLTRLANLAEMAGMTNKGREYLRNAKSLSNDLFFDHRLGESYIATNNLEEAEAIFSTLNLTKNVYANLRMSYFEVRRGQYGNAQKFVNQALKIDSLNSAANMVAGALAIVNGEFEQAIRFFRVAEEDRPTSSAIKTNKAIAYLCLQNPIKALAELKKAVSIDPLNQNAVLLLSDLAYSERCDEDAIPSLRFFVRFEQTSAEVWARLARAHLRLENTREAIEALKHQGGIADTADVWNNLGIAYTKQGQFTKAFDSFSYVMRKDGVDHKTYLLAVRNIASLLVDNEDYTQLKKFTKVAIEEDTEGLILKDSVLSDIWAMHLSALWNLRELEACANISRDLLTLESMPTRLRVWLVVSLLSHLALTPNGLREALDLIEHFSDIENGLGQDDKDLKDIYINNLAFVYAETGDLEKAEQLLIKLSEKIHVQPYPTATLGLIHMRKGHTDKGTQLYNEAVHLATKKRDKVRLRQKLNFELAKTHLNDGTSHSRRYLEKIIAQSDGSPELVSYAKHLIRGLPF